MICLGNRYNIGLQKQSLGNHKINYRYSTVSNSWFATFYTNTQNAAKNSSARVRNIPLCTVTQTVNHRNLRGGNPLVQYFLVDM